MDEYIKKLLDLLQYMGQTYDMEKKNARSYTMKLYFKYVSLILLIERDNF